MAVKESRLSYCLKHQDRVTDKRCSTCLKPICEECTLGTELGNFCSQDCYEKRVVSNERIELLRKEDEAQRIPRLIRKLVSFGFFLLVIAAAFMIYPKLPDSVHKPVNSFIKSIKGGK